jgi:alginate production protein
MNPRLRASPLLAALLLAACAQTPPATSTAATGTPALRDGQRADDRRPDQPTTVQVFGQPVELGGSWDYSAEKRGNFDLDRGSARDRRVQEHEIKLEARTAPSPDSEVFVQAVGLLDKRRTGDADPTKDKSFERGQTWVRFDRVGGSAFSVQAGRVPLIDRRAWWWDDDLDAVRVVGQGEGWRLDTGLAQELLRVSSKDRGISPGSRKVRRWFGQATWRLARRHAIELFWLNQRDASSRPALGSVAIDENATDPSDLSARWIGLRASGEFRPETGLRLAYWADLARVRGRESLTDYSEQANGSFLAGSTGSRQLRGHALDVGAVLAFPVTLRPSIGAAFARGSGGERSAVLDANFRQTGLQENKARIGGVKRLRRYGELVDPQLSNLEVRTLAAGVRLLENSSLELIGHRYRQRVASSVLVGSRLSADPAGDSTDIGREVDVFLAMREWKHLELTLRWSRFTPGSAFADGERDPAHGIEFGAALNF